MSVQPEDRTTIDMFAQSKPGRPRSNPYERPLQTRLNKRLQRQRDKEKGLHRLEVKLESAIVQRLDEVAEQLNMSRADVIERALKQWLHI